MRGTSLILASQSPQRKKILEALGLRFRIHPAHIDEHHDGLKKPHAIAKSIALRKAQAVAKLYPEDWVIGCDTIVILADKSIALKPHDREEARTTILKYRKSKCWVYSGLALVNLSMGISRVNFHKTTLYFKDFSDQQLKAYLDSEDWKDRSGSLTIEEKMDWIKRIEGDYWNVVGLPVPLFKKMAIEADLI